MDLKYKKPHTDTIEQMELSVKEDINCTDSACEKILKLTNHDSCQIVNSGNSSILLAMSNISGDIIVPNQGAWHGFKQAARFLNKELITIPTDKGLINNEHLEEIGDVKDGSALFLTSFAGYSAEQDIKSISKYCKDNDMLLVEDASGGISDPMHKLANGKYSDVIVCSTGSPKIINVGSGGFVTTSIPDFFKDSNFLNKSLKASKETVCGINSEIDYAEYNLTKTIESCFYVKRAFDEHVLYEDKRGINITFECEDKNAIRSLREKLKVDNKSIITSCPNYNRLKIKGFCLELKNINPHFLGFGDLNEIISIIKETI